VKKSARADACSSPRAPARSKRIFWSKKLTWGYIDVVKRKGRKERRGEERRGKERRGEKSC